MSRRRFLGSFSRHRCNNRRTLAGTRSSFGSSLSTAANVSETVSPSNSRRPVSISYSTTPKAQMSARLSDDSSLGLLRSHIGRRAEITPLRRLVQSQGRGVLRLPAAAAAAGSASFASPKSSTFTMPSGVTLMLAGFRSRWTMPFSCAASSASAIWRAMVSASSSGIGPFRCARQVSPSDQLHHQVVGADVVQRANIRVVQRGDRARFAFEAVAECSADCLPSHFTMQARVGGAIDSMREESKAACYLGS